MYSTNSHGGVVTQHGGVTRVQLGQLPQEGPTSLPLAPPASSRVGGTITRFDGSTGAAESSQGIARYQSTGERPNPTGAVMQSMQTVGGNRTVELIPGDPASRTLLSVAMREGLVVETAPGIFADRHAPSQNQQGPNEAPQGNEEPNDADPLAGTVYDSGEFAIWNAETENIPAHSYSSAVAGVTAALATANPAKLEGVISSLAQSAGMEPEQAREFVETGVEWYAETIARDLVKSVGMSREQVEGLWDEFRKRGHPRLAQAIQEVANTGRTNVFRELARSYKVQSAAGMDMSAFHKAGYETRVDRDTGDILVRRGQGKWATLNELRKG